MNMHAIWMLFFRGILYGFLGRFALIVLLFFLSSKRDGHLMYAHLVANPIEFLCFLLGMEIGIALIGLDSAGINRHGVTNERVVKKGIANHLESESCEGDCKAALEALTGTYAGRA